MLPFPQLIVYGNRKQVYTGALVTHSDSGFTDLALPSRVIQKSTTVLDSSTTHI